MSGAKRSLDNDDMPVMEIDRPRRKAERFTKKAEEPSLDKLEKPRKVSQHQNVSFNDEEERDMITGQVIEIVDGVTFKIKVTHEEYDNKYMYNPEETVKLRSGKAPAPETAEGKELVEELEEELLDQYIACEIHGRDRMGTLLITYDLA